MIFSFFWWILFTALIWATWRVFPWYGTTVLVVLWLVQGFSVLIHWVKWRADRRLMRELVQEAEDEMVDAVREPDDNRPYKRFRKVQSVEELYKASDPNILD